MSPWITFLLHVMWQARRGLRSVQTEPPHGTEAQRGKIFKVTRPRGCAVRNRGSFLPIAASSMIRARCRIHWSVWQPPPLPVWFSAPTPKFLSLLQGWAGGYPLQWSLGLLNTSFSLLVLSECRLYYPHLQTTMELHLLPSPFAGSCVRRVGCSLHSL